MYHFTQRERTDQRCSANGNKTKRVRGTGRAPLMGSEFVSSALISHIFFAPNNVLRWKMGWHIHLIHCVICFYSIVHRSHRYKGCYCATSCTETYLSIQNTECVGSRPRPRAHEMCYKLLNAKPFFFCFSTQVEIV